MTAPRTFHQQSVLQAAVVGLVQGLTEFLPVSSSAHLRVTSALLHWPDPGAAFTAVTQRRTEAAVLVYFRREIAGVVAAWTTSLFRPERRSDPLAKLGWFIILGSVPISVLGLLLQNVIETAFRDLWLIGAALIVFGLVLGAADRVARKDQATV
ncbi:undecaprenyl-diphosphatase UppP [Kribbella aluminosa]|uniref:Undecaprenyl-diphosphatase n=1 Tax=Kribbella aluminosa TaxID=416017 RepID=A0ABS4UJN0_9ACTN|nr:undecaprenyl-diphosphate phosphatase [Kribbella aluminosa]MBP2351848.1 undecaprenyl-diphosphatase UppP [Kribbella aluminosa]